MIQTVEVVAAVAAKVGPNPSPEDLDMVVKVVASQQNGLAESGMSLKESKRMSKLLSDLVRILRMESLYVIWLLMWIFRKKSLISNTKW